MPKRTLFVRLEIETDIEDHDAFYTDHEGLSYAAVWIESTLGRHLSYVEATVYDNALDLALDEEERVR